MENKAKITSRNTLSSDAFFQINKVMLKYLNNVEAAIILSEMIFSHKLFESKNQTDNGWWFITKQYLNEQTGFSEYKILQAEKLLESKNIIRTKLKGLPRKKYFYIDYKIVNAIIAGTLNNQLCTTQNIQAAHNETFVGNNTVDNNTVGNNNEINSTLIKNMKMKYCALGWNYENIDLIEDILENLGYEQVYTKANKISHHIDNHIPEFRNVDFQNQIQIITSLLDSK